MQAVDGLQTSEYLRETALKHIEGEIDIDEARQLIQTYYQSKTQHDVTDDDMQEADKVSANITKILSSRTLDFSAKGYIALHRRIFEGVFKHAGKVRDYNITKKEWVLEGDTVHYLNWEDLHRALDYDIEQERQFIYKGLTRDQLIKHIAHFVSDIWQIHAFGEGNTRTTAVFAILYLRNLGYDVKNVRAAMEDISKTYSEYDKSLFGELEKWEKQWNSLREGVKKGDAKSLEDAKQFNAFAQKALLANPLLKKYPKHFWI